MATLTPARGAPRAWEEHLRGPASPAAARSCDASGPSEVVGRDAELAALGEFLGAVGSGPRALLLEGEAGIGKTTLWNSGLADAVARSYRVLACRPARSEAALSFAALGDLLAGVVEDPLVELPSPQRRALEVAVLVVEARGSPPDQRTVALAFLNAVRALAGGRPLLLAVDDVQWLDAPSAAVLEFAARRLGEEPVGFLLTCRTDGAGAAPLGLDRALPEDRLVRIRLGPLSLGALHRLLQSRLGRGFPRPILRRLHALSAGNPRSALEIARVLEPPLPEGLEGLARDRLAALPPGVHEVLRVVAALGAPTTALVEAATGGRCAGLLPVAVEARVVELEGDRIRFTHPLLARAASTAMGPVERRGLHRRLARIVPAGEERARHRALAAEGRDARLAGALDEAARRARAGGAPEAAAELSEQAGALTPSGRVEERRRRAMEAAGHHFQAGHTAQARLLLEQVAAASPAGPVRSEALGRLARICGHEADHRLARELYREALAEAGGNLSVRAGVEAGLAATLLFLGEELPAAADHARAAAGRAGAAADRAVEAEALATRGLAEAMLGRPTAASTLERAVALESAAGEVDILQQPRLCFAAVRMWADDLPAARAQLRSLYGQALDRGDKSSIPLIATLLSLSEWLDGRAEEAARWADEGYKVALLVGQKPFEGAALAAKALVDGHCGRVAAARAAAGEALALAQDSGAALVETVALSALALLELSLGNAEAAHAHLGPLVRRAQAAGIREPGAIRFVPDEIEALVTLGRRDEGEALLDWFEEQARTLDRASALAACHRCRGLLAASSGQPERALAAFASALAEHERARIPLDHARTLLALGATQRRAKHKRAARESLQQALALFQELAAPLWADKARAELGRIGGRAPGSDELTPTEQRVATLVAQGRTNREVAASLFVTARTVEANLSRIYRKLGLRSRAELAHRLSGQRAQTAA